MVEHDRVALGLEAVAARLAAGLQAERAHRHHLGAVQRDQAVRRAHEVDAGPAVGELVAHHLGDRQPGDGVVERLLQAGGERPRRGRRCRASSASALPSGRRAQPRHGRGVGAERGELAAAARWSARPRRRGRPTTGISFCDTGRSSARARTPRQVRAEPARRGEGGERRAGVGQALRAQAVGQQRGEGVAQRLQRLRRQLLDEQLDEQVVVHGRGRHQAAFWSVSRRPAAGGSPGSPAFLAICASVSSAQARGAIGKPSRARLSR